MSTLHNAARPVNIRTFGDDEEN
ncbi:hypothetical protein FAGKG844_30006 [Frankia sp. AgKG'84/4]